MYKLVQVVAVVETIEQARKIQASYTADENVPNIETVRDNSNGWYTDIQIRDLLVAVQVFANANSGQGLLKVTGVNYGERAEHMLNSFLQSKSTQETVKSFTGPVNLQVDELFYSSYPESNIS